MTENMTITVWRSGLSVPDIVGPVYSANRIAYRGEVVTLTPEQIEETRDRSGATWLDLSEAEQIARWGHVKFKLGDHSAGVKFLGEDDSTIQFRRRENAVLAAQKIADAGERKAAFAKINELYGPGDSGQRTLRQY